MKKGLLFLMTLVTLNSFSQTYHLDFERQPDNTQSWSENGTFWTIPSVYWANIRSYVGAAYHGSSSIVDDDNEDFILQNSEDFNLSSLYIQWEKNGSFSNATQVVFTGYDANNNQIGSAITINTSSINDGAFHNISLSLNGIRTLLIHPNGNSNSIGNFFFDYFTYTLPTITWNGTVSSAWDNSLNWTPNSTPTATTEINIPAHTPHDPIINNGFGGSCLDLTIQSGASLTVAANKILEIDRNIFNNGILDITAGALTMGGSIAQSMPNNAFRNNTINTLIINNNIGVSQNTNLILNNLIINAGTNLTVSANKLLEIDDTITNNGTLDMTRAVLTMGGTTPQSIGIGTFLNNTLNSLIINNSAGVSLNGGLHITGNLVPTNGIFTTHDNLTLESSISGSASVTQGSSLGGYITGNILVKRYIGTANTKWRMIGFPFTALTLIGDYASFGYNAFVYNEAADNGSYGSTSSPTNYNAGWESVGAQVFSSRKGILIGTPDAQLATPIMNFGPINTGDQIITLSYSSNNANKGWNLIANPFASNIDWTSIATNITGLDNAIYRYDPNTDAYATYVNGVFTGHQSNIIENGAGFFVHSTGATSLIIHEYDKTSNAPVASLFGIEPITTINKSILKLSLLKQGETDGDEVVVRWGVDPATDGFDSKYDAYDMGRANGADLSVIGQDGTLYSIFHGSALKSKSNEQRIITLATKNLTEGNYSMNTSILSAMYDGNDVFLIDHYTNQTILISDAAVNYPFSVSSDANSALASRFSLALNYKSKADIAVGGILLLNNPSSMNQFNIVMGADCQKLNWQLVDNSGKFIQSGLFNNVTKGTVNIAITKNLITGSYFIKLSADGHTLPTQKWIKQ